MRIAIMQPTYLPWIGYFNLIKSSDVFVFLDDVQFAKRSWQQRNKILLLGKEKYLTIPVKTKNVKSLTLSKIAIDDQQHWRNYHKKTLFHAYQKHPFGREILQEISEVLEGKSNLLCETNISIVKKICNKLNVSTEIVRSSDLPVTGKKSKYSLEICKYLGADTYLSAAAAKEYIEEETLFKNSDIQVLYQNYLPKPYPQLGSSEFIPYLSIIDLIANVGWKDALDHFDENCFAE
ncbi:WbqC family protein [Bacillus sp. JJ1773]|uniref:WbqC family protein n=1 Tax=Bacillus sp. JJ1773 TaxID=3122965 RepID=UPI0030004ED8